MQGEKLKRPPKGPDHWQNAPERIVEYLKHKQFYWYVKLPAKVALTPQIASTLLEYFRLLEPAVSWLSDAVIKEREKAAGDTRPKRPTAMW